MRIRSALVGIGLSFLAIAVILFLCFWTYELYDWIIKTIFGG